MFRIGDKIIAIKDNKIIKKGWIDHFAGQISDWSGLRDYWKNDLFFAVSTLIL